MARRLAAPAPGFHDVVPDAVVGSFVWQGYGDGDWSSGSVPAADGPVELRPSWGVTRTAPGSSRGQEWRADLTETGPQRLRHC